MMAKRRTAREGEPEVEELEGDDEGNGEVTPFVSGPIPLVVNPTSEEAAMRVPLQTFVHADPGLVDDPTLVPPTPAQGANNRTHTTASGAVIVTPKTPIVYNKASGATMGASGTFTPAPAIAPANLAGMTGIKASPTTAWTGTSYMILGDNSHTHWNGTAWVNGNSPA
jgi:hypothetical protein